MNQKLKEPRIYLCIAVIVMMFLPWISVGASVEVMGISGDASSAMTGLQVLQNSFTGIFIFLLPAALVAAELIPSVKMSLKMPYLLGSILGIVLTIVTMLLVKSAGTASMDSVGASAKTSVSLKIGFWATIGLFAAIIIVTLIKDFAVNKEALKEKGLKNTLSDIAGEVSGQVADKAKNANLGEVGNALSNAVQGVTAKAGAVKEGNSETSICPSCGAAVMSGKKFCSKCGSRMTAEKGSRKGVERKEPITVENYIKTLGELHCNKCNAVVDGNVSFCPQCGEEFFVKSVPEKCEFCHAELIKGKRYCPDCGKEAAAKKLFTKCSQCGSDLYYGKKYCADCGKKIGE